MTPHPARLMTPKALPTILAAALLAAACSESTNPERALAPPLFSFSAGGIALDQQNSAMGEPGRRIVKGFNPVNPQNGDAIVVSFFWIGSTYIIDSVTDHLVDANWTKVGNTYNLVEYVTAGGISMATFVATGVQNIPPANPDGTNVLAVEAMLHDSVPDGGIWMSAWRGVEDVYAQALGAHVSGSGAGSAPTAAHPGTLTTTTSGALVYGVSMSRPPVGVDPPPGFTHIDPFDNIGDATLKADARYAVEANPTAVDPTWTWYYDQTHAGTWLATGLVLKAATSSANQPPVSSFTTSCSVLTCNFTSTSTDPDGAITGYSWNFGDGSPVVTTQNASHTYATGGTYTVTLTVTDNLGASNSSSQSVTVNAANQPPVANFTSSCSTLSCNFTSTSSDPDGTITGYSWNFGDGSPAVTTQNASHTYAAGGTYTVTLQVTDNLGASNSSSQSVTVNAANQPPVSSFTKSCNALTCNFTSTSSDPDGSIASYRWTFGDGSPAVTTQNASHTYAAGGTYTVTLQVTDNLGASNSSSQSVTVTPPNQPPVSSFTKSCNGLTCSFTSTSSDPDGSIAGYRWTFGDGSAAVTTQNASHTYAAGGTYTVTLQVTDNRGATNSSSQSVTVTAPNSPPVVNAGPDDTAITGLLWSFNWSFSDANHNGPWHYTINWGDGSTSSGNVSSEGTFSAGHTYVILLPRSFTIKVTVTDAAGASGSDNKVVSVLLL